MGVIYIYTLTDPIIKEVRYVGKTTQDPKKRYEQHISSSKKRKTYVNIWIDDLLNDNLKPILNVVDQCVNCNWVDLERDWVVRVYEQHKKLCNLTYIRDKEDRDPRLSINLNTENKTKKTCEEIDWLRKRTDLSYEHIINLYEKKEYSKCKKIKSKDLKNKKFNSKKFGNLGLLDREIRGGLNDIEMVAWCGIITESLPKNTSINFSKKERKIYNKIIRDLLKKGGVFYNDVYFKNNTIESILIIINKIVNELLTQQPWSVSWEPYKNMADDEWMLYMNY
jgi:hypothetical protein